MIEISNPISYYFLLFVTIRLNELSETYLQNVHVVNLPARDWASDVVKKKKKKKKIGLLPLHFSRT